MPMRVLVIKLTSMGDLMHALPALSDASTMFPGIEFDWVVDEAFAEVPSWHPSVKNIYTSAHRRWKKSFGKSVSAGEFTEFYRKLNDKQYDCIIDAQNNVKSGLISLLRKGEIHGMDSGSVAEQPAWIAYKHRYTIDKKNHAIARQRQLFANALKYHVPKTAPDYGLKRNAFEKPSIPVSRPYLVLVHNASWTTKLWPEQHWHEVIELAKNSGFDVVLPGGNQDELKRAQSLSGVHDNAFALPRMTLSEIGGILKEAKGAICCDTGLAHLAAMIGTPAVTLYGPTSAGLIGTTGLNQAWLVAKDPPFSCAPCYKRLCSFEKAKNRTAACMKEFSPGMAWENLLEKIQ